MAVAEAFVGSQKGGGVKERAVAVRVKVQALQGIRDRKEEGAEQAPNREGPGTAAAMKCHVVTVG